jgi:zinc transport system substrate-binding protein
MKYTGIYILLIALLLLAACTGKQAEGKVVTVTIEPQRFFAEKIAGDKFAIHCVVPSGQSPETYDPTPRQMVQIGQSEAYLQIGYIGFEQVWMQKIRENNPDLTIFDVSKGMQFVKETEEGDHRHEGHEADSGHHHRHAGGIDPHIWSSVEGARVVAWNTLNAFIELDKENTEYYWKNYNDLLAEIDKTEEKEERLHKS